jgi:uncharacterized Rmd1/YagE family protein
MLSAYCSPLPHTNTSRRSQCRVITQTPMRPHSTLASSTSLLYGHGGDLSSLRCFSTINPIDGDSTSIRSVTNPLGHEQDSIPAPSPSLRQPQQPGKATIIEPPVRTRPFRHYRGPAASLRRLAPTTKRVVVNQIYQTARPDNEYGSYPVKAVHAAQSIDLARVIANVFLAKSERRMMERHSVVVQLRPTTAAGDDQLASSRFVAVFDFGSVVLFNVAPREEADLLREIKQFATGPVLSGSERKEKFCVHVQPDAANGAADVTGMMHDGDRDDVVTADYCVVQELNMKAVDVISNVMAQSVALDSYNDTVDELLDQFEGINKKVMSGEGGLTTSDRDKMFRTVAQNNGIFIEMVSKVGIKDRIDTAWVMSQYENISEGMREEFDIDQRFEHIEFKLNLIQQNAKFFLEILAHQKSNMLEWIIIVLISFECVLMCMEMSGVGGIFFGYLGSFHLPPPS